MLTLPGSKGKMISGGRERRRLRRGPGLVALPAFPPRGEMKGFLNPSVLGWRLPPGVPTPFGDGMTISIGLGIEVPFGAGNLTPARPAGYHTFSGGG
jgi:hypothetical protein